MSNMKGIYIGYMLLCIAAVSSAQTYDVIERRNSWNAGRKDHPQVMNAAVRLYADAANAKTKMENGFDLTNYDERTLAFAKDYSNQLLAIDVNLDTTEMLDVAWGLFGKYFRPEEVNIKKDLVDQYWPKQNN